MICLRVLCVLCGFTLCCAALDRDAFTFTAYDLLVRIEPDSQALDARGKIRLRNDSLQPQRSLALQISSTLRWTSIRLEGKPVAYVTGPYTSDIDHTGAVSEAVVTLGRDVPPGAAVELELVYGGAIPVDASRLRRLGTPPEIAARTDWDRISRQFTAVRGIGYVAWYPVATTAANLSEPAEYAQILGTWKARHARSQMKLALQYTGAGETAAFSGACPAQPVSKPASCDWAPIGNTVPTFVVAPLVALSRPAIDVWHLAGHQDTAADYALAAERMLPLITAWFGPARAKVQLVELALPDAAPFESGPMLIGPLRPANAKSLEVMMAHQLAHAAFESPRLWIYEGLAHFAQALARERQDGRKAALAYLGRFVPALVETEEASSQQPAASALVSTHDEVLYRSKAMFVWWMLRDMVSDAGLQRALRAYQPAQDKEPAYFQRLLEAQARPALEWFFAEWVYRDRGLPQFRMEAAHPRARLGGGFLVTVTVENLGGAAAEVPVTVRTQSGDRASRLLVPAKAKASKRIEVPYTPVEARANDGSVPEADLGNNSIAIKMR
jgi:hypothetical protein